MSDWEGRDRFAIRECQKKFSSFMLDAYLPAFHQSKKEARTKQPEKKTPRPFGIKTSVKKCTIFRAFKGFNAEKGL